MHIVVASGNIFRRELSSFILAEAGHETGEARTAADLMAALRSRQPALIVIDQHLEYADPGATLRAVRLLSHSPILWIADPVRARPLLIADEHPGAIINWPFRGEDLLSAVAALSGRASAALSSPASHEHFAGTAE